MTFLTSNTLLLLYFKYLKMAVFKIPGYKCTNIQLKFIVPVSVTVPSLDIGKFAQQSNKYIFFLLSAEQTNELR